MASTASTNLSFLYFLQGDNDAAENYAELAKDTDSYNAAAFVNLGNLVNLMFHVKLIQAYRVTMVVVRQTIVFIWVFNY